VEALANGARGARWFEVLWRAAVEHLLERSETPPSPPPTWAQAMPFSCRCEDCAELAAFLRDPVRTVARFKMAKERRRHLHQQLDQHGCDVTHQTERIGSPQTLICTKNRKSFEARVRQREEDVALLHRLAACAPSSTNELEDVVFPRARRPAVRMTRSDHHDCRSARNSTLWRRALRTPFRRNFQRVQDGGRGARTRGALRYSARRMPGR
jgi:hypothetical protein